MSKELLDLAFDVLVICLLEFVVYVVLQMLGIVGFVA